MSARVRHVVHLVTNDARMDSRVRRHAGASAAIADRVTLVALEPAPGIEGVPIPGVETVRAGVPFVRAPLYRAGRELTRAVRRRGRAAGEGAVHPPVPAHPARGGAVGLKTLARDRLEVRHLDQLARRFAVMLERLDPDVVVCNDLDTLGAGLRYGALRGAHVVFDSHELWPEHSAHRSEWWVTRWTRVERALAPRAAACVTVNPSLAEVLSARWGGCRVDVVRNALPLATAPPPDVAGTPADRPLEIVYVGAYLEGRGLPELVEAVARMPRGRARLTLYGYGALEPVLRARGVALGCESDLRFEPPIPQAALVAAVAQADVGVIPYQPTTLNNRLATPTKLYEYLCAGLAVAASDLPAMRAIVEEASAGVLFDPHDPASIAAALEGLAAEPARLAATRAAARAAFRRTYNWEHERDVYLGALVPTSGTTR